MKRLSYFLQGLFAHLFLLLVRIVPVDIASAIGGFIGRRVMIHSKWTKIAKKNIRKVYPNISKKRMNRIVFKMWNNIGRTMAEAPHLEKIATKAAFNNSNARVNVKVESSSEKLILDNAPIVFIGAHISNWEIIRSMQALYPIDLGAVYRSPNNPYIRELLNKMRGIGKYKLYAKDTGMLSMIKDLRKGVCIGVLVDQWLSKGEEVIFLGQKTRSSGVYASFAKKYGSHIIPIEFVRISSKCKFRLIVHKELEVKPEDTEQEIVQKANDKLSDMIHRHPSNWLWIHDRFKILNYSEEKDKKLALKK